LSGLVRTGIIGLDQVIGGGLPEGYCYLVLGGPGAGKTIFGIQFLYNGIVNFGESGVYVTLDEPPLSVVNNARNSFNWDLFALEDSSRLAVVDASPIDLGVESNRYRLRSALGTEEFSIDGVIGLINEARRRVIPMARRCVIDSITALSIQYERAFDQRLRLLRLIKALTEMRLTTLLLAEMTEERWGVRSFGHEAFLSQGVFVLHSIRVANSTVQALEVVKLRGVKHERRLFPYRITSSGIEIYPEETIF